MIKYIGIMLWIGLACSGTTPNAVQELEQAYTRNEQHIEEQREKQSKVLNELLTDRKSVV